ncbi:MAG: hypothetical protein NC319_10015 [Butyricicoccus sp.]|nr:hypothetical protein [Butyricicoccus sp.]
MKKIAAVFLSLILLFSCFPMAVAAEAFAQDDVEIEYEKGPDLILENVEILDNGWICITQEVTVPGNNGRSYPEREKTKVFSHTICDRNGIELAVFDVTVTGVYSQADNYATLTSITGSFTGSHAHDFTYTSALSGDTGSATIYFNGLNAGTFSYKIYTNGNIQWI